MFLQIQIKMKRNQQKNNKLQKDLFIQKHEHNE